MVRPSVAVFGEKDWQQLRVVTAMVRRDGPPVEIVGAPTVREPDGLAMSSRNIFLGSDDRTRALAIGRALGAAGLAPDPREAERRLHEVLAGAGISPDYAVVRDASSLAPLRGGAWEGGACRALVGARVGPVRLLDNAAWPVRHPNGDRAG
jgi:pantoate--beta-alanine ligase